MDVYLSGEPPAIHSFQREGGDHMQLYIAGVPPWRESGIYDPAIDAWRPFVLESFYYADKETERLIPKYGDFLLDSGAFTFMNSGKKLDWDEYIERYADFIVRNDVKKYFELDLDTVVGYEKTKGYRRKLEKLTNRPSIPVWHKNRGYAEYLRMCDEYGYAAIGGVVTKEIKPEQYGIFPKMIRDAHNRECKVHGLGFTALKWLPQCHFDSVDSTAWTTGNRFGYIYKFDGKTMRKIDAPKGKRLADAKKVALINFTEWVKFQKYAINHFRWVRKPRRKTNTSYLQTMAGA